MNLMVKVLLVVLLVGCVASKPDPKHPGCWVWWFAPHCPLAKMFGVDPFHIYPWKKFCKIYSDFSNAEVCEKYVNATIQTTTTVKNPRMIFSENEIET